MSEAFDAMGELSVVQNSAETIDDCWNRIGVRGDKSCPLLVEHVHCRNCPVYAKAAIELLDRYALDRSAEDLLAVVDERYQALPAGVASRSLLVFRLADEWLALPTRSLIEVANLQPVHSLPHQRARALLGVANVRGELVPCLSLVELLGVDGNAAAVGNGRTVPRMIILAAEGGAVVAPVDEVDGIHRIELKRLEAGAATSSHAANRFTQAVIHFRGRSVRVLDEVSLLSAMTRSLT